MLVSALMPIMCMSGEIYFVVVCSGSAVLRLSHCAMYVLYHAMYVVSYIVYLLCVVWPRPL